jgi:tRNA (guanosine-2'-O-)-methyltransferase
MLKLTMTYSRGNEGCLYQTMKGASLEHGSGAIDRRTLAKQAAPKEQRWPRTQRRQERVRTVLSRRQPDLTVVLENVHDPHNVSAVLRTCDAVGILEVHAVYTIEAPPDMLFARQTSASAVKWVAVRQHRSIEDCYRTLRLAGMSILATALAPEATDLYEIDLASPVALVFGNEMRGVSEQALQLADGALSIPMVGMVQSLNISVACAVCLYEAFRQRQARGAYDQSKLPEDALKRLENDWLKR